MREQDTCPDLGKEKVPGHFMPIHSQVGHDFPECPAAFLRTASDVETLRARYRYKVSAPHLIDGVAHPGHRVSEAVFEVKSGARNVDSLSSKMLEGVHLWMREEAVRTVIEAERKGQR